MEIAARIRREVAALGPRRRGAKLPVALRRRIAAQARAARSRGASVREIAVALGVSAESIRRWTLGGAASPARPLVPVIVRDAVTSSERLVVRSPAGYQAEGLTLDQAAELLRRLG